MNIFQAAEKRPPTASRRCGVCARNADSYWVDGYFEETNLAPIRIGDPARIKLMGHSESLGGVWLRLRQLGRDCDRGITRSGIRSSNQ
jgi:hypothetical protein